MNLTLTDQETQLLINLLAQGKYVEVAPLIAKIAQQVKEQTNENGKSQQPPVFRTDSEEGTGLSPTD